MLLPERPREDLGWPRTTFGLDTFLVDHAADQLFHRHAGLAGLALEPGFVTGIHIANGDACAHVVTSGSVDSVLAGCLAIILSCREVRSRECSCKSMATYLGRLTRILHKETARSP